ncbi:DUF2461 family protein [Nocardioides sp.]|uniref:DUF2461 family protein n=1 Tax=Nocardioides sp. TaxID=35761 RepID=UPI003516B981
MTQGIFDGAIAFYRDLEADNTREFWARERHRYDDGVKPVFAQLVAAVSGGDPGRGVGHDVGGGAGWAGLSWRVYRPHNDTRFGNATPFKTFAGAVAERADGVGAFLQVSARGALVGTGLPMPARDQLPRLRAAIAEESAGADFARAVAEVEGAGVRVFHGRYEPLKRVPAGYPTDHPRADVLRWKGIETNQRLARPAWGDVEEAAAAVVALLATPEPLHRWLAAHVGPSAMTPEERFAPRRRSSG